MSLTKRKALEICLRMWKWLALNPSQSKLDAIEALSLGRLEHDCAACDYAASLSASLSGSLCDNCPVWTGEGHIKCLDGGSPYYDWSYGDTVEVRASAAKAIVGMTQTELDKLGDDE